MARATHWCQYSEQKHYDFSECSVTEFGLHVDPARLTKIETRFRMVVPYSEAWHEVVEFPRERFVTYEPKDAEWAVPLGIAKLVRQTIQGGVRLNLKRFTGEDREVFVKHAGVESTWRDNPMVLIEGTVPNEKT